MTDDQTRDALLTATLETLLDHGLKGATTRRIAERAGVNEVTVFRRFGNKTTLLREALTREAQTVETTSIRYTGDLDADVERVVRGYVALVGRIGRLFPILLTELPRHPELRDVLAGPMHAYAEIGALLARYQAEGRLAPEPPTTAVAALLGPIVMTAMVSQALPGLVTLPDPAEHTARFLHGRGVPRT